MCDLIDLKSPEGKTISGTKLASPLIPAPSQTSNNDENNSSRLSNSSIGLNIMKRNSLDNNPFDNAHHKTVEYVRKQDDPFETVLEKALMHEDCKSKTSICKARAIETKDDFTPIKRRYSDVLKMNKTLDESVINLESNIVNEAKFNQLSSIDATESSIIQNSQKCNSINEETSYNGQPIPKLRVDPTVLNSSILNQSAMNDSLTESSGSLNESLLKSSIDVKMKNKIANVSVDPNFLFAAEQVPKLVKHRRSLSQGDKMSPRKFREHRCHSIVDGLQIGHEKSDSSFISSPTSIVFEDIMNTGFLRALSSNNASAFSNLSNISSITRSTSLSSAFNSSNSSSAFSNRTANCAFIESYGSDGVYRNCGDVINSKNVGPRRLKSNGSVSSMIKSPIQETQEEKDLNELISKYTKLRIKSSESSTNDILLQTTDVTTDVSEMQNAKLISQKMEDKLIDIDVFIPETKESSDSFRKKSISSTSSDSIFVDSDTIEKSIFLEAKSLAKTFEELASKTRSSSRSSDDLVNSRPHWNFEMLPPSDDEASVDDLIKLQESSGKSGIEILNGDHENEESTASSELKSEESLLKELDMNFRDPEKKIVASTLLLDLEKLVKSEKNAEAAELLKSLEKALGVKCDSNVDLLETCLSVRNDLTKSPKRSEITGGMENIKNENIEKSREDNTDIETSENFKQLNLSDDKSLQNNINVDKVINKSDKSPILVSKKYDDLQTEENPQISKNSSEEIYNDSIGTMKQQDDITNEQKMAVEILVALGKLLTGENKDPTMSTLLKNLGNALNLVSSNHHDHDVDVKTKVKETKRVETPVKNRMASPRKSPAFSRTANRKSLEFNKTKPTNDRIIRRSMSVIQTPTSTTSSVPRQPNIPVSSDRNKAHLKEGRKRFSSDPSFNQPSINGQKSNKEISLKSIAVSELARQDKPSSTVIGNVKNRFRKKIESDATGKKGPMKAVLPIGNMQRRGSSAKKDSVSNGSVTPPKPIYDASSVIAVTTSTPFPTVHLSVPPKKSPKSKPIASSTPDDVATKYLRRSASQIPQSPKKNTLSCNISPVTSKNKRFNDETTSHENSMSSRSSKVDTPLKSRQSSQLPKLSPMSGIKTCSLKSNYGQRRSEPLGQSFLPKNFGTPKSPRGRCGSDGSTSPLNTSNKLGSTVKPLNLISKLERRKASVAEKENYA